MIRKLLLPLLYLLSVEYVGARFWNYEPISLDSHTSNPDKLDIDVRIKRMPLGEFAYEGYLNFAYDVNEDTIVEINAYRSTSGEDNDYTPMPWIVPKQSYVKFVEGFYVDIFANLAGCSNLPAPEKVFPWKRGNYTFKECDVEGEGLPEIAPQGYYKVVVSVSGEVEWGFESVARITDKLMP